MMAALVGAAALLALVFSPHCAGMCGPIAVLAGGRKASVLFHAARIAAYAALGAAAGAVGSLFDVAGGWLGVERAAAIAGGTLLLLAGAARALAALGLVGPWPRSPAGPFAFLSRRAFALDAGLRAALLGVACALLPCGLLWTMLASAGASGDPAAGAAVALAFGLATVPGVEIVGAGVRVLVARAPRAAPWLTAAALVLAGLGLVTMRAHALPPAPSAERTAPEQDRSALERAAHRLEEAVGEEPPCCRR